MATRLTIGELSRMTHLSVKALRHYHDVGLLVPAAVDPSTGYRSYAVAQVPVAQAIRRFRDLDMPLDEVRTVLLAGDVTARDEAIVGHLRRMERRLDETQSTIASLRALLEGGSVPAPIELRSVEAIRSLAVRGIVEFADSGRWVVGALRELFAVLEDAQAKPAGACAALYAPEVFEAGVGEVVAFVPVSGALPPRQDRTVVLEVPAAELAVIVHRGPFADLDQSYGLLGTFVAERAIGAPGPIREHYLVHSGDTRDVSRHVTEVCWPVVAGSALGA